MIEADYTFYANTYHGTLSEADFNRLLPRASAEIDALTFERGRPRRAEEDGEEKHLATEMCQVFANHWGYAARDSYT